jgi:Fibrinogen beta and gamma chains, C-terminal globular domain
MVSWRSSIRMTEMFAGNENIHWLTSYGKRYKLRIDLGDFSGNIRYAEYDNLKVGSACSNYILTSVGSYCATAGNQLYTSGLRNGMSQRYGAALYDRSSMKRKSLSITANFQNRLLAESNSLNLTSAVQAFWHFRMPGGIIRLTDLRPNFFMEQLDFTRFT